MEISTEEPCCVLLVGKPKSGKTHLLKTILQNGIRQAEYFKFGLVFSETSEINEDYAWLPQNRVVKFSENRLKNYIDFLFNKSLDFKNRGQRMPPSFLVLDDCIAKVNLWSDQMSHLLAIRRHLNVSIFIVSQSLFAGGRGSSTLLRDSLTHGFFWSSNQKGSLKGFYESFGCRAYDKLVDFVNMFRKATSEKHRCLAFRNSENENEMFSFFKGDPLEKEDIYDIVGF